MSLKVVQGGLGGLGQTHSYNIHHYPIAVHPAAVGQELRQRGYVPEPTVVHEHEHVTPTPTVPTLTYKMAIHIAVDEGIRVANLPHTNTHLYRCPTGSCPVPSGLWNALLTWCADVANKYMSRTLGVPSWALSMMQSGQLQGLAGGRNLGGFVDTIKNNPWILTSLGSALQNFGDYLTTKQVQEAIKKAEAEAATSLKPEDIPQLVAALQAAGYIKPGQTGTVAEGALAAASPSWMVPAMLGLGAVVVFLLIRK